MDFLYANSIFTVQNEGTYLPRITRETCTLFFAQDLRAECASDWNNLTLACCVGFGLKTILANNPAAL